METTNDNTRRVLSTRTGYAIGTLIRETRSFIFYREIATGRTVKVSRFGPVEVEELAQVYTFTMAVSA